MDIVIGKIGKSIKFNSKTWGATGGPNEAPVFFQTIARLNPKDRFFLISKNDFSRLSPELKKEICPNNNIIDIWENYDKKEDYIYHPINYFKKNNILIDCGLIYGGSVTPLSIPNKIKRKNSNEFVKVLQSSYFYSAPIINFFNETNIKFITLVPDPRYVPLRSNDLLKPEKISLTLFDGTIKFNRMKSFEEQNKKVEHSIDCRYTKIETVYLLDKQFKYEPKIVFKKDKKLVIFHNEGGVKELLRSEILNEYVLKKFPAKDIEIWGSWSEEFLKNKVFKGEMKFNDLQEYLPRVKYTFMIPIEKDTLSMKYWESIHNEIIPFMHEFYDISNYTKCPKFLRIKNPQDLKNKIKYLEDNPQEYMKLLTFLKGKLTQEMYNGKMLNEHVYRAINDLKKKGE